MQNWFETLGVNQLWSATLEERQRGRRREQGRKERQTRQGRSKECFAWKESGRGWVAERKGGCGGCLLARRHRCVSDVICGCHGDPIDWPTRRQTSRESRRHSDYCPSPRPSDCTPTSTTPPSFSRIYPSCVYQSTLARHANPCFRPDGRANASKHTRHASIQPSSPAAST